MCESICVLIDSTELYRDYKLEKASLRRLLNIVKLCGARILFPMVVVDELIHQQGEDYEGAKRTLEQALNDFRYVSIVNVTSPQLPDPLPSYSTYLDGVLQKRGIEVADYPQTTHQDMVRRFQKYKKPLGKHSKKVKDDAGYKDALIWETALELLDNTCSELLFVSANHNDFAESDTGSLHPDLLNDLEGRGHLPHTVKYVQSLEQASDYLIIRCGLTIIPPGSIVVKQISENVDFDLLLTNNIREIVECINNNPSNIMIGDTANEPYLYWNIEDANIEIESTEIVDEGEVVVHANAVFYNEITYYMHYSSWCVEDERLAEVGIHLYDANEDTDMAQVGGSGDFSLQFSFVYNPSDNSISGFEVLDIRRTDINGG